MRVEKLPFCHYHKERHKPTHCRQCGKFLPNCRLWYCGGVWGGCAREYFALENWQDARDLALKRTEGTCQKCGGPATEVHHLEPVRGAPRKGECNRKSNLMALCHKCHLETLPRTKNIRERRASFIEGAKRGLEDYRQGKLRPWAEVKKELGY